MPSAGVFIIVENTTSQDSTVDKQYHLKASGGITEVDIYSAKGEYFKPESTSVIVGRIPCILKTTESITTGLWDYEEVQDENGNYYKIQFKSTFIIADDDPITIKYRATL